VLCGSSEFGFVFLINPFLRGSSSTGLTRFADCANALRGVPGDVGGRARGAELMECTPRLRLYELVLDGPASGERVLVNVIATENGSPAK